MSLQSVNNDIRLLAPAERTPGIPSSKATDKHEALRGDRHALVDRHDAILGRPQEPNLLSRWSHSYGPLYQL